MPTYHPSFHQSSKRSRSLLSLQGFLTVNLVLLGGISFFWSTPLPTVSYLPAASTLEQRAVQDAAMKALETSFNAEVEARLRNEKSSSLRGTHHLSTTETHESTAKEFNGDPLAAAPEASPLRLVATTYEEVIPKVDRASSPPPGVVVLGMHRSGTSLLTGLLFRAGLWVGDRRDLIWGASATDNAKGFFERTDVVLQNDYLMKQQKVHWSLFGDRFNASVATQAVASGTVDWQQYGAKALKALLASHASSSKESGPRSVPWALKDPRLCLTLRFWLPLLTSGKSISSSRESTLGGRGVAPAVLFTYRHPVEVAKSLQKREGFGIKRGLLLWLAYNEMALRQSQGLCLVATSNAAINASPLSEVTRVARALEQQCNIKLPRNVTAKDVAEFVDPSLQHNHATVDRTSSAGAGTSSTSRGSVNCDPSSSWESFQLLDANGQPDVTNVNPGKRKALKMALEAFCALERGAALQGADRKPFYDKPLDWG